MVYDKGSNVLKSVLIMCNDHIKVMNAFIFVYGQLGVLCIWTKVSFDTFFYFSVLVVTFHLNVEALSESFVSSLVLILVRWTLTSLIIPNSFLSLLSSSLRAFFQFLVCKSSLDGKSALLRN